MTNAVTAALEEKRTAPATPRDLIMRHSAEFTGVLPTHIQGQQGEAWLRLAAGALKTGKFNSDRNMFELEVAASNNPAAFMQSLRKAASMGLQPGTDQYYLTPVRNKDNGGRTEILGIVGYKGYIELMYRGGHVASVIVQTVHEGEEFDFVQGRDVMPMHHVDWRAKRGKLELVYAYAKMHSGAVSNVVILNEDDIEGIKKKSASAKYGNSPWQTDTRAMWLKSAVRRLQTWVPWSIEIHGVGGVPILPAPALGAPPAPVAQIAPPRNPDAAQIEGVAKVQSHDPDQIVDATLVEPDQEPPPEEDLTPPPGETGEPQMSAAQRRKMMALFSEKGFKDTKDRHTFVEKATGVTVENSTHITISQAVKVIDALEKLVVEEAAADVPSDGPAGQ